MPSRQSAGRRRYSLFPLGLKLFRFRILRDC